MRIHMDIRLDGTYEEMVQKLADYNQEPTATGMVRNLVRDAAKQAGIWPPIDFASNPPTAVQDPDGALLPR